MPLVDQRHELYLLAVADSWFLYLEDTQGLMAERYVEVESWAWSQLQIRLRAAEQRYRPRAA